MEHNRGFTLIEIMITVVALAILAAIAIPNYSDYVRRGKIPEATSSLQAMKTKMEQYFQDNRSYPGACVTGAPGAGQIQIPTLQYFNITCNPAPTATTFAIQAVGGGGSSGDNSMAGITFAIDQGNTRSTTVVSGSAMDKAGYQTQPACWASKKGAAC